MQIYAEAVTDQRHSADKYALTITTNKPICMKLKKKHKKKTTNNKKIIAICPKNDSIIPGLVVPILAH